MAKAAKRHQTAGPESPDPITEAATATTTEQLDALWRPSRVGESGEVPRSVVAPAQGGTSA